MEFEVRTGRTVHLDWAVASRPMPGETVTGDAATVHMTEAGNCVLAVVDGLGHGPEAAAAADEGIKAVRSRPGQSVDGLVRGVHRSLQDSRGAALTVAIVDGASGMMSWAGIGDVDAVVIRNDLGARPRSHGVFLRGGVLGQQLPPLPALMPVQLEDGDCIIVATDGVGAELAEVPARGSRVDHLAQRLLSDHALPNDDALVLVARYRAKPREVRG